MDDMEEDLSWLTQQESQSGDSQNYWRRPETVPMVQYVYDNDEYVEPNPHEVVIHQHLDENDRVRLQHVQNGLIDNFNTSNPPLLSLESSGNSTSSLDVSEQQTQRFSDPVTQDDLLNMQRKT